MESTQKLSGTRYSATHLANKSKQQEEIEKKITDWASQHPLFKDSYGEPDNKEIITAFYNARLYKDADSLYKAGEYCRDHPELKWDVQAIFFFHDSIEQRDTAKQSDPEIGQKIQAAQDNLDNMLLEGRGISEFDPESINRKVRDYCLDRLDDIEQKQSGSRASDARYQLMKWYLCKSDFVPAVKYFCEAAKRGSQSGQFGLQALISLLRDNPPGMEGWDREKLMQYAYRRADRLSYSQSDDYAAIWVKNQLSICEKYYASATQWDDVKAQIRAFEKGEIHYACVIGMSYYQGKNGVDQDMKLAAHYLTEAFNKESKPEIAYLLAQIYEDPTMAQAEDSMMKISGYLEFAVLQNYGPAALKLLKLNVREDPNSAFLLSELFQVGNEYYGVEPDQHESQKYLDMAAQKNHLGAMQKYLMLWRSDELLPEFRDIVKYGNYEAKIKEDDDFIEMALKSLEDYESGRVKALEYGPDIPGQGGA